jgi:hypothetical protein
MVQPGSRGQQPTQRLGTAREGRSQMMAVQVIELWEGAEYY